MCYDVQYLTKKKIKYAEKFGEDPEEIERLKNHLEVFMKDSGPVYHTTAFDHWKLPVVTNNQPKDFQFFQWGFIPHFVENLETYEAKYANRYLNSRVESLFDEKIYNPKFGKELDNPFYKSAMDRRCVVVLDGYFDWHWQGKNSYNFHIQLRSEEPMLIAGIWRTWKDKSTEQTLDTVSLVTTDANPLCNKIHNKPKASEGPRQLAMLTDKQANDWLSVDLAEDQLKKVITVFPEEELTAYSVKKLFQQDGRRRIPLNDEECVIEASFPELKFGEEQGSLF